MNRLITILLTLTLAACASMQPISLPPDGVGIEGVDVGDQVRIVMRTGQEHELSVTQVDEKGLHGDYRQFYAYRDMQSVSLINRSQGNNGLLILLALLLLIAAFAEPEISGSGPLCLQSSEGGPCLP